MGYIEDQDVMAVTVQADTGGDEEDVPENWDTMV
jgi:hypothetical protein